MKIDWQIIIVLVVAALVAVGMVLKHDRVANACEAIGGTMIYRQESEWMQIDPSGAAIEFSVPVFDHCAATNE